MKKILFVIILFLLAVPAFSIEYSLGVNLGLMPLAGGNLHTSLQEDLFGAYNGIEDINATTDGAETQQINRPVSMIAGIQAKLIAFNYYFFQAGGNFLKQFYGGGGKTLDINGELTEVLYTIMIVDVPLLAGITVPLWDDASIYVGGGVAISYGVYQNSFRNDTYKEKGTFKGIGVPLVVSVGGEYFLTRSIALTSGISVYRGSSEMKRSGNDYGKIDFSGCRWTIGVSFFIGRTDIAKKIRSRIP